jgi:1,4-alpha-glucan branching enzyme
MSILSTSFFTGIHNDPRLDSPRVYSMGSYSPGWFPPGLEYLYFTLTNNGGVCDLAGFHLESGDDVYWELDLPEKDLRGQRLDTGRSFHVGFLKDLLCRKLRYMAGQRIFNFRAVFTLVDGRKAFSEPLTLDLNYPDGPMRDADLTPYSVFFDRRVAAYNSEVAQIKESYASLAEYATLHKELGLHKTEKGWIMREWMPAASELWLTTDKLDFATDSRYAFQRLNAEGLWELELPEEALGHGVYYELHLRSLFTAGKIVKRVPAFADWVEQNQEIQEQWCARVWAPEKNHKFRHKAPKKKDFPRIYEAHIGIAQAYQGRTEKSVGSYADFAKTVLPIIKEAGYNAVQLMGIPEHPLYKSFGYQVSGYFAPSSRFGSPNDFKALVDEAHRLDITVILDITHSHAAPNTEEGIAAYDSGDYFFAHKDNQWGTRSFNYANSMARRFLLSNCRYWMEEYKVDGFRFDAVGNMIYVDHGFGDDFNDVGRCFYRTDGSFRTDEAGVLYLSLANTLIHEFDPRMITIAEEFSGMPGMTTPPEKAGLGFDYRFAMGIPDFWAKFIKEGRSVGTMWHEMTNHRYYEATISYVASHDQSINGDDAMIWRLIGDDMYYYMSVLQDNWNTSRGLALYKMMRFVTFATASDGYLSFMGDEFGHPEWIDAEGYAHRQWHLPKEEHTKYFHLAAFDRDALALVSEHPEAFALPARLRYLNDEERVFAFERGDFLFVFNFHEIAPAKDLQLWVTPGKYTEFISSDAKKYAGHGNLAGEGVEHFSAPGQGKLQRVSLYLPPLTALVLVRS